MYVESKERLECPGQWPARGSSCLSPTGRWGDAQAEHYQVQAFRGQVCVELHLHEGGGVPRAGAAVAQPTEERRWYWPLELNVQEKEPDTCTGLTTPAPVVSSTTWSGETPS